jgi:mRNA-degrading endonuclease RelE of RelBE toxin-antitoxin system
MPPSIAATIAPQEPCFPVLDQFRPVVLRACLLPVPAHETTIVVTMFEIRLGEVAVSEIAGLRAVERRRLLDAIDSQLTYEPAQTSRRKKMLSGLIPPWEQVRPVWQLRVGDLRVFYDVDESTRVVIVRAVRRKEIKRTEEIL